MARGSLASICLFLTHKTTGSWPVCSSYAQRMHGQEDPGQAQYACEACAAELPAHKDATLVAPLPPPQLKITSPPVSYPCSLQVTHFAFQRRPQRKVKPAARTHSRHRGVPKLKRDPLPLSCITQAVAHKRAPHGLGRAKGHSQHPPLPAAAERPPREPRSHAAGAAGASARHKRHVAAPVSSPQSPLPGASVFTLPPRKHFRKEMSTSQSADGTCTVDTKVNAKT